MSTAAALDRFALLAQLPSLPSLEEKAAALAQNVHATVACTKATVVVFSGDRVLYAHAPQVHGFTLRESDRALRKLFLPSLARFEHDGAYLVPHAQMRALTELTGFRPQGDLLVLPLETADGALGAIVLDMPEEPARELVSELRTFSAIAAWMIELQSETSTAEREARQSALLALINERARKSLDRQSILETVVEDVRHAFNAMRCVVFGRDRQEPEYAVVLALAESADAELSLPSRVPVAQTWLERAFGGSVVSRERASEESPRDALLRAAGGRSALVVPLVIEGRIEHALALHFADAGAFDDLDIVMLRSVASHVGLALANVQLYDLERLRRARAESLERVVRMLRDTQTLEEVLLVFAVTVSHEVKLTCAAYELERGTAHRRAARSVESGRAGLPEEFAAEPLAALLEREDVVQSSVVPANVREVLFGNCEGLVAALRIDGNLWGFVLFSAARGAYDWGEGERRVYFHMLASHLELALSSALGFERVQHLARALSESNEFKDDLLAMLAHDFKGPLTVISGYCELLLEDAPEEVREELETIYSQTKRLVRLADDAVALAQTQAGGFSLARAVLDLRTVVEESVRAHNRSGDRIVLDIPAEAVPVSLDAARFNHVLDNLLLNALKYSEHEVRVRVRASETSALVSVTDRGIGIPQGELSTVFARFGRATNARRKGVSGSGVGLYVSRKIVEVHGGSIAVQSAEGEGSTFTVTLPLAGRPQLDANALPT